MNILFVSKECPPSPRSSGIGTYVWETGRALAKAGHNVRIIAASDDGQLTSSTPLPRVTVIRLPDDESGVENRGIATRALHAPFVQATAYRRRVAEGIATAIDDCQPDVIEFPGIVASRPFGFPGNVRFRWWCGCTASLPASTLSGKTVYPPPGTSSRIGNARNSKPPTSSQLYLSISALPCGHSSALIVSG